MPKTVTVIDPRHPLHGRTFPLLHITNKQELVRFCLVMLTENVQRLIPVAATDWAQSPPNVFPLPLDIPSLQSLIETFNRIAEQIEKEDENGEDRSGLAKGDVRCPPKDMDNVEHPGARGGVEDHCTDLPGDISQMVEGGES